MEQPKTIASENIRLRAKAPDRALIDQAAELLGTTRSQFMMVSALDAAKNVLLDQTAIYADTKTFNEILDWMDNPASSTEKTGMKHLKNSNLPWPCD